MPVFEVFDTVVLKANRQLVGVVDRTDYDNDEPLQDILIIAHIPVDQDAITEFVHTGHPPKNHIFVRFSDEAQGHSLVHVNDVILIDRSFTLGDPVKRMDNATLGTVVSIDETFTLQPIWTNSRNPVSAPSSIVMDEVLQNETHICSRECPFGPLPLIQHPLQNCLLHGILGEELKKAEDVVESDFVVQGDWMGVVEELELLVVVLLEDESIVVVKDPEELYLPVPDHDKPLVSLPEFDNLHRPDLLVAHQGWSATIPLSEFQCGQMVVTNQRNLRQGRWLQGQYNPNVKPQGRILDVKTRSIDVRWVVCNALIPERPLTVSYPNTRWSLYENINTFPKRAELRSNKNLAVYDYARFPRTTDERIRPPTELSSSTPLPPTARSQTNFRVGNQVKFRDQAGAALKYQGVVSKDGIIHGKFDRIPAIHSYGFDVNEFRVICSRQVCTVRWQDGSISKHLANTLFKFALFEPDLGPGDLVVAREGTQQVRVWHESDKPAELPYDFNEMKFFENPHNLLPTRVGVVQHVNQAERLAQVRWFTEPKICITHYGHVLEPHSRFGKISELFEDVSLYEIVTFPALSRRLKDVVTLPPSTISLASVEYLRNISARPHFEHLGQASITQIHAFGASDLLSWLQYTAFAIMQGSPLPQIIAKGPYRAHHVVDWVGEIVGLDLDGIVTVRLNTRDVCKDVRVEHDQLICLVDEGAIGGTGPLLGTSNMGTDVDISMDGSETGLSNSTISETVEYEGGQRIDTDSGDENWEDADEEDMIMFEKSTPMASTRTATPLTEMAGVEHDIQPVEANDLDKPTMAMPESHTLSTLQSQIPKVEPASFAVLDRDTPLSQYQKPGNSVSSSSTTSYSNFLKRITKEHRILTSSLPKGKIFVRTYENRLDLMRCLIIGPADTPYEYAPFVIDLQLGMNFPREPPIAHFHSWTTGLGRINPNLYEEGKICLSLLGTWPGQAENERWTENSTILQLLVSLQGLVFVRQPFFNEAGYEGLVGDQAYNLEAQRYNEKAYLMARRFVKHAIAEPVQGFEDVLAWTYLPHGEEGGLLAKVISRGYSLIDASEKAASNDAMVDGRGSSDDNTKVFLKPLSLGAIVMLKKTIRLLERLIALPADTAMTDAVT